MWVCLRFLPSRGTQPGMQAGSDNDDDWIPLLLTPRAVRRGHQRLEVEMCRTWCWLPVCCGRGIALAMVPLVVTCLVSRTWSSHTRRRVATVPQQAVRSPLRNFQVNVSAGSGDLPHAEPGQVRVACIGASITEGKRGYSWSKAPYPDQLQVILGPGYKVVNFGVGDRTVLKQTPKTYWKEAKFKQAKAWNPHFVVFQFGADDTKFPDLFRSQYPQDFASMIRTFQELPSHPTVLIMTPPPVYNGMADRWKVDRHVVNKDLPPRLSAIARANHLSPPISVWSAFYSNCSELEKNRCPLMTKDGIHPNQDGFRIMAHLVHTVIKTVEHRCAVPDAPTQCGDEGISELECKQQGCCHSMANRNGRGGTRRRNATHHNHAVAPLCFRPHSSEPEVQECPASNEDKSNCGWFGITTSKCRDLGCCFARSRVPRVPWCFYPFLSTTTTTTTLTTSTTETLTTTTNTTTATTSTTVTSTKTSTTTTTSTTTSATSTTSHTTTTSITTSTATTTSTTSTTTETTSTTTTTTTTNLMEKMGQTARQAIGWVTDTLHGR
mmetsp:Transcript_74543/g.205570  ORF Transcript_74543/g.205570 Transcript_74543/m.205570 type:complete len:550 (-) Transcript_74543:223-1872(-)